MERENKLELRMMGLVPYNISPIQQAIQFGHAVVEYGQKVKYLGEHNQSLNTQYNDWANNWKTFIILNGGISNHSQNRYQSDPFIGSMETNLSTLEENKIKLATFYEPDLNDMLSAIVFIVDERVFNKEDYPDFINWYIKNINWCDLPSHIMTSFMSLEDYAKYTEEVINGTRYGSSQPDNTNYDRWVEFIGGKKNVFLRGFLKNFKLA